MMQSCYQHVSNTHILSTQCVQASPHHMQSTHLDPLIVLWEALNAARLLVGLRTADGVGCLVAGALIVEGGGFIGIDRDED